MAVIPGSVDGSANAVVRALGVGDAVELRVMVGVARSSDVEIANAGTVSEARTTVKTRNPTNRPSRFTGRVPTPSEAERVLSLILECSHPS